jgi:hypothetical protein
VIGWTGADRPADAANAVLDLHNYVYMQNLFPAYRPLYEQAVAWAALAGDLVLTRIFLGQRLQHYALPGAQEALEAGRALAVRAGAPAVEAMALAPLVKLSVRLCRSPTSIDLRPRDAAGDSCGGILVQGWNEVEGSPVMRRHPSPHQAPPVSEPVST